MIWQFRCRKHKSDEFLIYRGLLLRRYGGRVDVFCSRATPLVTTPSAASLDALQQFMDGVLAISSSAQEEAAWDDVPWEIHLIADKTARDAAYSGWASQNGYPDATHLINQLNYRFSGDLYEI